MTELAHHKYPHVMNYPRKYQPSALIFDLDGTLLDSMGDFGRIAAEVMHEFFGISIEQGLEDYRRTSGLPFYYQVNELFPGHNHCDSAVEAFETRKAKLYEGYDFFPDVQEPLQWLKQQGFFLAVSSNNFSHLVEEKMRSLGIAFDDILGFRPGFLKGPDHFRWIGRRLNVQASQMLFIGDSLHDARMAHEFGIDFAARLGTFSEPDFLKLNKPMDFLHDMSDLKSIVYRYKVPVAI